MQNVEKSALPTDSVWDVLRTIDDPEMPVSIVDLGIVHEVRVRGRDVAVDITPTFIGCPALDMIREQIERGLRAAGAARVTVNFVNDPPWSVDRISAAGRESLRRHGVSVPTRGAIAAPPGPRVIPLSLPSANALAETSEPVACPHCGATPTTLESAFGPTRCRMIYYCEACRNSFEHLRRV